MIISKLLWRGFAGNSSTFAFGGVYPDEGRAQAPVETFQPINLSTFQPINLSTYQPRTRQIASLRRVLLFFDYFCTQ